MPGLKMAAGLRRAMALGAMFALAACAVAPVPGGHGSPSPAATQPALSPRSQAVYDVLAAELALRRGNSARALDYYRQALARVKDPRLAQKVVTLALAQGKIRIAQEAAGQWAALAPEDPEAWRAAGLLAARAGETQPAIANLRRYLALEGAPGPRLLRLGAALAQQTEPARALQIMHALVAAYPHDAQAQFAYGVTALRLDRPRQALRAARRALALDPGSVRGVILEAEALSALGRTSQALARLRAALRRHPGDIALTRACAEVLVRAGRYAQARREYETALARHPHDPALGFALAVLDFELGRDAEARRRFQRLAQQSAYAPQAEYFLGLLDERAKRPDRAIAHYARVDGSAYALAARVRMALLLAQLGEPQAARRLLARLRQVVSAPSQQVELYLAEAELEARLGEDARALAVYDTALRRFPDNPRLRYARALLAGRMGNLRQAETDLKALLQARPDDAAALNTLGYLLTEHSDRYREALGYIRRALALRPGDPAVLDSMGWVQYRLGHYPQAVAYLRRAYAEAPDPEIAAHLVTALLASGRRSEADAVLRAALEKFPGDAALGRLRASLAHPQRSKQP